MKPRYVLEAQVGFLLRQANQRHISIFAEKMPGDLTPPQFAALTILFQNGPCSQNELGRRIATDGATIAGIVARLIRRGLVTTGRDPADARMLTVALTDAGTTQAATCIAAAPAITATTLAPLTPQERSIFLQLLKKLC